VSADVLSDVLRAVRLTGAVYFDLELTSPWVAAAPPSREIAAKVMPGAQRVIEYHLMAQGLALWRMQLAARLLVDGGQVAAVASAVGYESEAAFSRAFKKLVGEAPATWRKRAALVVAGPRP
jgi:hypothetical protein